MYLPTVGNIKRAGKSVLKGCLSRKAATFKTKQLPLTSSASKVLILWFLLLSIINLNSVYLMARSVNMGEFSDQMLRNKFLPSTFGTFPTGEEQDVDTNRIHIAFIFDEARVTFSLSAIRSIVYYSLSPVTFHLISPTSLHQNLKKDLESLEGDFHVMNYDYDKCLAPSALVSFIAPHVHISVHCKPFLAEIIPSEYVLFVDNDVTVLSDLSYCWNHLSNHMTIGTFGEEPLIAMGVDMGDVCQLEPEECFPIGMKYWIPPGLKCGTTPSKSKKVLDAGQICRAAGEFEPYQFNGGVILMNLNGMRKSHFTARFVQASIYTWRSLNYPVVRWGQDLLNNFFRLYPNVVVNLPCGCNYQFSGTRRESKCPNQFVALAHVWNSGVAARKRSALLEHFFYFLNSSREYSNRTALNPPPVKKYSQLPPDWKPPSILLFRNTPIDTAFRMHDPKCSLQSYACHSQDVERSKHVSLENLDDEVTVLSNIAHWTRKTTDLVSSIYQQTSVSIKHVIGTRQNLSEDKISVRDSIDIIQFPKQARNDSEYSYCSGCFKSLEECNFQRLIKAQKLSTKLRCLCKSQSLDTVQNNELQKRVYGGWVMYLDDDHLLTDKHAISQLLASIEAGRKLVIFRSFSGHKHSPSDIKFLKRRITMGYFGSFNIAIHSSILKNANWSDSACGGYELVRRLARSYRIQWINHTFVETNPERVVKISSSISNKPRMAKTTVLITSYLVSGWRPLWVRRIIEEYTAQNMRDIVSKVILVWNNPEEQVPKRLQDLDNERFLIVRMKINSLNNRWTEVTNHIDTDSVLNFDDDIFIRREAVLCLMNWFQRNPSRMIAPFVRQLRNGEYSTNDLLNSSMYSMVLPRVILLPTKLLQLYSRESNRWLHEYVDIQDGHCDDVLLNVIAQKAGIMPLRIVLPASSMIDWFRPCLHIDKALTGGVSLALDRTSQRTECVKVILERSGTNISSIEEIATCTAQGNAHSLVKNVHKTKFTNMVNERLSSNCKPNDM